VGGARAAELKAKPFPADHRRGATGAGGQGGAGSRGAQRKAFVRIVTGHVEPLLPSNRPSLFSVSKVGLLNGAPIKGSRLYPAGVITFRQLQEELPFPTKMVVVPLPGAVLQARGCSRSRCPPPCRAGKEA
jgi:hypothetical protein